GLGKLDRAVAPEGDLRRAAGQVDAGEATGHHLLRDQRVVRERQADADGRLAVAAGERLGAGHAELLGGKGRFRRLAVAEQDDADVGAAPPQLVEREQPEWYGAARRSVAAVEEDRV